MTPQEEEQMTSKIFTILAGRSGEARERLKKFDKKAKRYGVPFSWKFGEVYLVERTKHSLHGKECVIQVEMVDVTIAGETPKVGEYEFVASIEVLDGGNFVDTVPGLEIHPGALLDYRETDGHCDHCRVQRARKHVFIARKTGTSQYKQIGRTCLRDFLGTDNPNVIIQQFAFWRLFDEGGEEDGWSGFGSYPWEHELRDALALTGTIIRLHGWCSKGAAYNDERLTPTVEHLWDFWSHPKDKYAIPRAEKIQEERRESDETLADEVIAWVRASTDDNDYFHNLRVSFRDDLLGDAKRLGLAISAVASYHRHIERELKYAAARKQNANSAHVGEVKERLRGLHVTLEQARSMGDNGWGETELLKFRSDDGDLFAWFTGSCPRLDIGEKVTIDGTVKRHSEFKGTKETLLTRVRVLEAAA